MEPIGGYFGLELAHGLEYHKNAIRLNTGRNCLEYILRAKGYKKVYVPYYTCEVVLEPFAKLGVEYEFYHIDIHLEIRDKIILKAGEALLYTNYFGLKQNYVELLNKQFGKQLIIDNTQAFYAKPIEGIDTFYTCRKFFGVPDGAYLYTDKLLDMEFEQDKSYDRFMSLTKRIDLGAEFGYADFRELSKTLVGQPIKRMSKLTQCMMQGIDYAGVAKQRKENFNQLHKELGDSNAVDLPLNNDDVPMVYPCLLPKKGLREKLIENKIYVARYWPNVIDWVSKSDFEYNLVMQLIPLPIDQRYDKGSMDYIIKKMIDDGAIDG